MSATPVYMDYQATTPVDPRVLNEMIPFFTEKFGNASSRQHRVGWVAEEAVENARANIASVIGASAKEIVFTSGATESNNLAIKGTAESLRQKGNHVITVQTEHHSVLDSCKRLARQGFEVTVLPVAADGILDPDELLSAIRPETILVSVMFANNEIGVLHPVARIGALCHERGVMFHCDATQGIGRMQVDVQSMGIDLLSSSGHKIYGPKGIGILYVRSRQPRVRPVMQMDGGGHENGLRSGTLNVPSIVGYAKALRLCADEMPSELERLWQLHHRIISGLRDALGDVHLNGHASIRLPHNINLSIPGIDNNTLMMSLKDIAMSTGSACSTSDPEPSHVLKALRLNQDRLHSSIRLGIGRFTTIADTDIAVRRIAEAVTSLRASSRRSPSPETVSVN